MTAEPDFADFLRRIRAGDERAAQELVEQYEPIIRREVRLHLQDQRLRRVVDSVDVKQSVLASFFLRATAGQYDLESPDQLAVLLIKMARNKVASQARREHRQRRDARRADADQDAIQRLADNQPTPSEVMIRRELIEQFQERLTPEERKIAEMRSEGLDWSEVAQKVGGTAQARRMQLTRAVDRVTRQLGLED